MTVSSIKVKVQRKAIVKLKVLPRFPSNVATSNFVTVTLANGTYTFGIDYTLLDPSAYIDPANTLIAVLDQVSGSYKISTISALISGATEIDQHVTAAGPVAVLANAGIVRVDQTVGASITLNMPLASAKTCPVLISDWKGDAGINSITIALSGSDVFPGGGTSWTIAADTGSVFLRPIAGVGYVL